MLWAGAWASGPAEATPSAGTLLSIGADAYDTLKDLDRVVLPDFAMPGGPVALTLTQFDILAPDAVIVGATDAGDLMIPRPEVALFHGQIDGHEGSQVFLSITPEAVNGFIRNVPDLEWSRGARVAGRHL
jgi:hypothetical protein